MQSHRSMSLLVLCSSVLLLCSGVSVAIADDDAEAWTTSSVLETEDLTAVSRSGTEIVGYIDEARASLDRGDWIKARYQTAKARSLLAPLRDKSPSLRLRDRIAAALDGVRSGSKPSPDDLLPIYAELDAVSEADYADDVRAWVDKARAGAKKGDVEVVEDSLVQASAQIRYLEIDLPIEETHARLSRALMVIDRKDLSVAKQALREAEEHIQTFVGIASTASAEETAAVGAGPQ